MVFAVEGTGTRDEVSVVFDLGVAACVHVVHLLYISNFNSTMKARIKKNKSIITKINKATEVNTTRKKLRLW